MTNTRTLTVTDTRGTVRTYPVTSRTLVDAYILAMREAAPASIRTFTADQFYDYIEAEW